MIIYTTQSANSAQQCTSWVFLFFVRHDHYLNITFGHVRGPQRLPGLIVGGDCLFADLHGYAAPDRTTTDYFLTDFIGFSIFFAKLSDIYGRRNILILSWIIFVISSVACGCSYNMSQL